MKNKKLIGAIIAIFAAVFVIGVGVSTGDSSVENGSTTEVNTSTTVLHGVYNDEGELITTQGENDVVVSQNAEKIENVLNSNTASDNKNQNNVGSVEVTNSVIDGINNSNKNYKANLKNIPAFSGKPYYVINGNVPGLKSDNQNVKYFEKYSPLDSFGRCGVAYACLGKETMPTEERGEIGQVKPSGWKTAKYNCVDGKYLFNRCHLIGFQLSGENANNRNLITGTRYMNVEGMLPFENMVADYIKETGNHVLYRVTPIFQGDELVARGVQMEAYSVEDNGDGICFNVYCYNNQPSVKIDYATGNSELVDDDTGNKTTTEKRAEKTTSVETSSGSGSSSQEAKYILNTNSKKIHRPTCSSAKKMKESNKQEYTGSKNDLLAQGYTACGICNP
ncbi:MAG: DNA/RNA non-specific endonuclease [Clostridia bacterium]|nr:DNA/RNA non-specific endonuclease [Clostridia bacterium]